MHDTDYATAVAYEIEIEFVQLSFVFFGITFMKSKLSLARCRFLMSKEKTERFGT